jgi:hypothetical protein
MKLMPDAVRMKNLEGIIGVFVRRKRRKGRKKPESYPGIVLLIIEALTHELLLAITFLQF